MIQIANPVSTVSPRPFLKWVGGKGQLISQYLPHFPTGFSTYYEPFLGGGAIFFHLLPPRSHLMDINPELVNVFACIRDHVDAVIIKLAEHRDQHCEDYYYQVRAEVFSHPIDRAARFIYLNKTCFNGLYRENSKGLFNVPMGQYKKPPICDPDLLYPASAALQGVMLTVQSFERILDWAKGPDDFVYFDPPYHPISSTSSFTSYSRQDFTVADQIHLRDVFMELRDRGVKVMLSNSDCPFVRELYQDFTIHTISASRSINSNAKKRAKIDEVVIIGS